MIIKAKDCFIWKLCVNRGNGEYLESSYVIRTREDSTSVGFSREIISMSSMFCEEVDSINSVLLVCKDFKTRQSTEEWDCTFCGMNTMGSWDWDCWHEVIQDY
jgi:hypothetical protein